MRLRAFAVVVACLVGAATGVGGYTFVYAKGAAYLTNDPNACANCHVMREQLDGWAKSSHHAVAVCNDCHAPHDFFGKYWTKLLNGWNHSFAFTTGDYPNPIRITPRNAAIAEEACRHCHSDIVAAIDPPHRPGEERTQCVRCHESVGHLH